MMVLGIDPGYATIGFGIIECHKRNITVEDYGVITTDSALSFGQRLCQIAEDIEALLSQYSFDIIAMEQLFWGENVDNAIRVAEARGVIEYCIAKKGIRLIEYSPSQIKSRLVGNGKAEKFQVQTMLRLRLKLETIPKPDDAADALAIALVCAEEHST